MSAARVPALDGLRGVALLLMVLFHTLTPPFSGAFISIDMFFVLSGYLICSLLLREWQKTGQISLLQFYVRRFLRLMPALWVFLATLLALVFFQYGGEVFAAARREGVWAFFYISNWVRALGAAEHMKFFAHTWSLGIEEQFYLLWPAVLCFCVARGGVRRALQAALALAAACWLWRCTLLARGAGAERLYNGLDTRLDALMWGCALAAWLHGRGAFSAVLQRILQFLAPAAAAAIFALVFALGWDAWRAPYFYRWTGVAVSWLTGLLIADVVHNPSPVMAQLLRWRPLAFLGVVSYGVYLWHWGVEMLLVQRGLGLAQVRLWTFVLTPLAALPSFYVVERPFLRMKSRFTPQRIH